MHEEWSYVIGGKKKILGDSLRELSGYRDLIWLSVKRDFIARFKQTVLGPVWILVNPIFTMFTYTIVFGKIANLSTDGVPAPLFYLVGNILWTFFAANVNCSMDTFQANAGLFSKVYFPRLITICSNGITILLDFLLQFLLAVLLMGYYRIQGMEFHLTWAVLLMPLALLQLSLLGTGIGMLVCSLTTKYRDLRILAGFLLTLWMYASPIIYSTSLVPSQMMRYYLLNPVTPSLLMMRYGLFGVENIYLSHWALSWGLTFVLLILGIWNFQRVQRTFQDTF